MLLVINSILHFMIDGVCALAMMEYYSKSDYWYIYIFLYNFCAFALQMPIGFVVDYFYKKKGRSDGGSKYISFIVTLSGIVFTLIGVCTHPVILGIGNALFHIGGGVCTINEDISRNKRGSLLGVFVAPGALGLYLGKRYGNVITVYKLWLTICLIIIFAILSLLLYREYDSGCVAQYATEHAAISKIKESNACGTLILILCVVIVIIRSYVTLALSFGYGEAMIFGLGLTMAAVLGKACGGVAASALQKEIVIAGSLILSAICFALGGIPILGMAAVFFFNMTMPITLYELITTFEGYEGGMFGILTFALFIGFIPVYIMGKSSSNLMLGTIASIISLVLLLLAVFLEKRRAKE